MIKGTLGKSNNFCRKAFVFYLFQEDSVNPILPPRKIARFQLKL